MAFKIALTGDVNLMNVTDPTVPFAQVAEEFRKTDFVFSNLECCLYQPPVKFSVENEGFFADPKVAGEALKFGGIQAVGIANNVNYGETPIKESVANLDKLGIPHTGAGVNSDAARAPIIVERGGVKIGVVQRTSVYWPTNHEARATFTGVAALRGHTAYHLPMHKMRADIPPPNRPGLPPIIMTFADKQYLAKYTEELKALREKCDILIASCHWGYKKDVLEYMEEIGRAAVDAGADVVMGHGPHFSLPVEVYKGKPIFYGLGSFSFHTGHGGIKHGNWVGQVARLQFEGRKLTRATYQFVRHNDNNNTVLCSLANEEEAYNDIVKRSEPYGTTFTKDGDQVVIGL